MKFSLRFLVPILWLVATTIRLSTGGVLESATCFADLNFAVKSKELWAIEMLDAMGKPSESILRGNIFWPGGYDQCQEVVAWTNQELGLQRFRGRYCRLQLQVDLSNLFNQSSKGDMQAKEVPIYIGICVPNSCKAKDMIFGFNTFRQTLPFIKSDVAAVARAVLNYVQLQNVTCVTQESPFTSDFCIFSCVLCLFVVFLISVSILDYKNTESKDILALKSGEAQPSPKCSKWHKDFSSPFLLCFSIPRNMKIVFGEPRDNRFEFLNGLRFLSICLVIMHHVQVRPFLERLTKSPLDLITLHESAFGRLIFNTDAVSTFLFIGGFCFSLGHSKISKLNLNTVLRAICIRYLRLFPPVAFFMMINKYLLVIAIEGPLWEMTKCNVGFTDLLYVPLHFTCFTHLWYVEVDFKCFLLGLLLMSIMKRSVLKFRLAIAIIFIFAFVRTLLRDHQLKLDFDDSSNNLDLILSFEKLFQKIYRSLEFRSGAYLTGMLLGLHCLTSLRHGNDHVSPRYCRLVTLLGIIIVIGIPLRADIFGKHCFESSIGYLCLWNIWGLGIGCLISSCLQDSAGLICRFLSLSFWRPLANLSFSAYLINEMVIAFVMQNHKFPVELDVRTWIVLTVGMIVLIFVAAIPFALLFELPFMQLGRFLKPTQRG